jgi:O-antigen/teichoic acid export membrane protein
LRGVTPSLFKVVLFSIPIATLFGYLNAFLTGREKFRERAGVGIAENAAGLVGFLMLMLLLGRTADSAMWGYFAGIVVGLGVAIFLAKDSLRGSWRTPSLNREVVSGLFTGVRGQIGNVAAFFNYRFDVFIVNYFLDPVQVGLYALGVVISEGLWQIPQATALALFPRTARTSGEHASGFTCLIMRHVFMISCFSAGMLALVSPIVVPALFGERFSPSVRVIWWILPGTIALSMGKVAASHLSARHKTGRNSLFGGIALVVTLGLDVLLIPRIGIAGAAIASSASYLLNGALLLIALRKELGASWRALFVPSREELLRYKSAWASVVAWARLRRAML